VENFEVFRINAVLTHCTKPFSPYC